MPFELLVSKLRTKSHAPKYFTHQIEFHHRAPSLKVVHLNQSMGPKEKIKSLSSVQGSEFLG
jgi:hypothetical protein